MALALMLVVSACANGDGGQIASADVYEFPAELVAAGAANVTSTTAVPRLSEEPTAVEAPPPRTAVEAILTGGETIPLPSSDLLPDVQRIEPYVVTSDGQRRLLQDVSVSVTYDLEAGLVVEPAGWWVINYPLDRIVGAEGRTLDDVATTLLGRPVAQLTNYYFYTEPDDTSAVAALPAADGPARIAVTPGPDLVVNNRDQGASDGNDGSYANPLLTISAAVDRAGAGDIIHVYPGVYRESVVVTADGTATEPIRIEGIRGASGAMPVITGNDVFPAGAWSEVEGLARCLRSRSLHRYGRVSLGWRARTRGAVGSVGAGGGRVRCHQRIRGLRCTSF